MGLTNDEAPTLAGVPSGSSRHSDTSTLRNWEYICPPAAETVFPRSACAAGEDPAAITVPAPSFPTAIDSPSLPESERRKLGSIGALATGKPSRSVTCVLETSAPARSSPRSEGLTGAASTRMTTSFSFGTGIGISTNVSSSVPLSETVDRSCNPEVGVDDMIPPVI